MWKVFSDESFVPPTDDAKTRVWTIDDSGTWKETFRVTETAVPPQHHDITNKHRALIYKEFKEKYLKANPANKKESSSFMSMASKKKGFNSKQDIEVSGSQ